MKTNLLLLDSYKNMENLIHFGFSFSNKFKRKLKIIYVFDFNWMKETYMVGSGTAGVASTSILAVEKNAQKEYDVAETKVREIVAEYMKKNSFHFPVEVNVTKNNRINVINEALKEDKELMVIISNHQSYAEKSEGLISYPNIIDHVDCPVLVVPEDTRYAVLNNVVYATDFNPEDINSIAHLSGIFKNSKDAHITILHNENKHNFDEKLKWTGFKHIVQNEVDDKRIDFVLKSKKDLLGGIEEFSEENDPDLLVLMKEKKGFLEDIFTTNKTKSVLTHFNKPILVYHEK